MYWLDDIGLGLAERQCAECTQRRVKRNEKICLMFYDFWLHEFDLNSCCINACILFAWLWVAWFWVSLCLACFLFAYMLLRLKKNQFLKYIFNIFKIVEPNAVS